MSDALVRRLLRIRREYDVTRDAAAYVTRNWQKQNIFDDIQGISLKDLRRAASSLDAVFVIRLLSTFEGILKEHLAQHHPHIAVPEEPRS